MSNLINFVRGIDLSDSGYSDENPFPKDDIKQFQNLRWLNLDRNGIESVPAVLSHLRKLEHLSVERNQLFHIPSSVGLLESLRSFKAANNELTSDDLSVPAGLFRLKDLSTIDLSNNKLSAIPDAIRSADGLLVLDLNHNEISGTSAAPLPSTLFVNCTELRDLDLSFNKIEMVPPAIRSAKNLTALSLAGNPLQSSSLRPLLSLDKLENLDLHNTDLSADSIPEELGSCLSVLTSLNLSQNRLANIPQGILDAESLERLDLSSNQITELPESVSLLKNLKTLNVSRNAIIALPASIGTLDSLRALYANMNKLVVLPPELSKLTRLIQLRVAGNRLISVPRIILEGCKNLETLKLHDNRITSLSTAVHDLKNLQLLSIHGNDGLKMPKKQSAVLVTDELEKLFADYAPYEESKKDTDREHEKWVLLGLNPNEKQQQQQLQALSPQKRSDLMRGRDMLDTVVEQSSSRKQSATAVSHEETETEFDSVMEGLLQPKAVRNWASSMFGESLDYSKVFGDDTGKATGISRWRIEQFSPVRLDKDPSTFASGDCYVILSTFSIPRNDDTVNIHEVFFWLGSNASQDKKACAAINAVQLRDYLRVRAKIRREEQGEESTEFLKLYDDSFDVVEGGTESGFYEVDNPTFSPRLYLLRPVGCGWRADSVPTSIKMFAPERILLLFTASTLYLWRGQSISNVQRQRSRLFAERALRGPFADGQSLQTIVEVDEGSEKSFEDFHSSFMDSKSLCVVEYNEPSQKCRIFQVKLGHGFLELPQLCTKSRRYSRNCLRSSGVFIIDNFADIFVWFGIKSSKLLRTAAERLAGEIEITTARPPHAMISYIREGCETTLFKTCFDDWHDVLEVDHRLSCAVGPTHALPIPKSIDLRDLFMDQRPVMSESEAQELEEQWRDDLEKCDAYVLQKNYFVRMAKSDFGVFFSENCYVFLCKEWHIVQSGEPRSINDENDEDEDPLEESMCTAYFWQGRDAGLMGWLRFQHSFANEIAPLIAKQFDIPKLRVVKEYQGQESMRFMALFEKRMLVYQGHKRDETIQNTPHLFHVHSWLPQIYTRTVEVPCTSQSLNSHGVFILRVPFEDADGGIVYLWIGSGVDAEDEEIARKLPVTQWWEGSTFQTVKEGSEPDRFFWSSLPGPTSKFDRQFLGIFDTRIFECTSTNVLLPVLTNVIASTVYIISSGGKVYLWVGYVASDVLLIWSRAAAKEHIRRTMKTLRQQQHIDEAVAGLELQLPTAMEVRAGEEPLEFRRLFHAWGRTICKTLELRRPIPKLNHILDPLPPLPPIHERHPTAPFYIHRRETLLGSNEPMFKSGETSNKINDDSSVSHETTESASCATSDVQLGRKGAGSPAATDLVNQSKLEKRGSGAMRLSRRRSRLSMIGNEDSSEFDVEDFEKTIRKLEGNTSSV